jgi:deoxyribonuclease V
MQPATCSADSGLAAAVDVHYPASGGARAAAVLAAGPCFSLVVDERIVTIDEVLPYQPGAFYLRELPPLLAVLAGHDELGLVVVDGYADLDNHGRPGLGARLHAELRVPVVGVQAGRRPVPCSSPRPECRAARRPIWSGIWAAGSACPTPCAGPTRWPGPRRRPSRADRWPRRAARRT